MTRHPASFSLAAAALAVGVALSAGQNASPAAGDVPSFKLRVDYVEVDAVVTDPAGRFVRGLESRDFQIFEDGQLQEVSAFSVVDLTVERYERPLFAKEPIEPDVKTNERPFDGRVYVLLIDDLHTNFARSQRTSLAARKFIQEHLGANDLMAVLHTAGPTDASQEFTSSRRLLLAAVDKTSGRKLDSATLTRTADYYSSNRLRAVVDPFEAERASNARRSLEMVRDVAQWLQGVHGRRKTILFFSEGIDYDVGDVFNNMHGSLLLDTMRETIATATRANVSVYGIDPRGLTSLEDETIALGGQVNDPTLGIGSRSISQEILRSQDSLRELAEETGGLAVVNANDFDTAFDRIVHDNSSYYVLAYYPRADTPGTVHRIDVRVNRGDATVRARRAYVTPGSTRTPTASRSGDASRSPIVPEIADGLESPIPISGLVMRVFAAPFKGAAPNASVLVGVEVRGRELTMNANDALSVSSIAVDTQDKVRGGTNNALTMNLKPDTKAFVAQTGMRLLDRVDLPPGRYQLRFAAHESGGGRVGSVSYDLEVPDFSKGALTLSGIVLTSMSGALEPTLRPDEQLKDVLPAPPIAKRAFPRSDEVALFAEVYDNEVSKAHKVEITATVTADEGRVMFKHNDVRESKELKGKRGGYGYGTRIPLGDFAPGSYVLTVAARSSLGDAAPVQRQLQFTVGER